jgi:hypothetical protein
MIISEQFGFAFVHIPKCAGMYVQKYLGMFDDYKLEHYSNQGPTSLAKLKLSHYSLERMSISLPEQFEQICRLESFALVREPTSRFISSTFQYLRENYKSTYFLRLLVPWHMNRLIPVLCNSNLSFLPTQYIHFTPQTCYINFNSIQVVQNLYLIDDASKMVRRILTDKIGREDPELALESAFHQSRGSDLSIRERIPKFVWKLLPKRLAKRFSDLAANQISRRSTLLYDALEREVANNPRIQELIHQIYASDIKLYQLLTSIRPPK